VGADRQNNRAKKAPAPGLSPFLLLLIIATGALLCTALPQTNAQKSGSFSLTILHTNDLHSHDQSFAERGKTIGGMARLAHLIRQYRAQSPHNLTIDAGDIFQGTPFFTIYKGEVEVEMLNRAGYDIYTIGNHEFDGGGKNLARQLQAAKFEILSCNLDCRDLPELGNLIKPSTVRTIDGEKVGFVGAITPDIDSLSLTRDGACLKRGDFTAEPETAEATANLPQNSYTRDLSWLAPIKEQVNKLTAEGVNKIILVTHCGVEVDKIIASELPAVDAIIGGHSHTKLDTPVVIAHKDGTHTLIVQTGCYSRNLGKFDLVFDKSGAVDLAETKYKLLHIDARIPEDKDIKDALLAKEAPVKILRDTIVTEAQKDFDNNFRIMKADSALGDLITDSFVSSAEGKLEGVEVALENRGGIRSRIDEGPVSLEKVEEILPFENHMVYATITGARLRQVIEHSIDSATGGKFLDVAGLQFAWDPQKPGGQRLVFIKAFKNGHWKDLEDGDTFRIAMTDYSFSGGEGYDFKDATDIHKTEKKLNLYLRQYMESFPIIKPQWPNRICPVSAAVLKGVLENNWGDLLAGGYSKPQIDIYTSAIEGVSSVKGGVVLPLKFARCLATGLSGEEAKTYLQKEARSGRLQKWTALVMQAYGAKHNRFVQVSYPCPVSTFTAP
jgi:5'-nucleotidase / UDP-sugar diphosphatase